MPTPPTVHAAEPVVTRRQLLAIVGAVTAAASPIVAAVGVSPQQAAAATSHPAYAAIVGLL
ncbi:hypothetical protein G5C66_11175 [Nocardioides sp. KC13]|uniref:Uncharacterized protein n=1 Tax=Nocardioides turkmenicus TaxID=2711220 RepID=A0A6M1R6X2_9ACTN|nr:hypothetical protein [Nocardioides sp. KC13]NGN93298.1 hypothetical protein [Nocardioides sp. KC13]